VPGIGEEPKATIPIQSKRRKAIAYTSKSSGGRRKSPSTFSNAVFCCKMVLEKVCASEINQKDADIRFSRQSAQSKWNLCGKLNRKRRRWRLFGSGFSLYCIRWRWDCRPKPCAGTPSLVRGTRIVAPWALLAIPDAPPACIAHWARQASVPPSLRAV